MSLSGRNRTGNLPFMKLSHLMGSNNNSTTNQPTINGEETQLSLSKKRGRGKIWIKVRDFEN